MFGDKAVVVIDLGFGDAGKGATVDWLCSLATGLDVGAVVRFNGGAQAAHNVVTGGRHHTFSQFGSGTFSGVPTFLAEHVLVEPIALAREAKQLADIGVPNPLALLTVDERALLTTPIHVAANRTREEARGAGKHGSCGLGIGETAWYALEFPGEAPTVGDCRNPEVLRGKLEALAAHYRPLLAGGRHRHPDLAELAALYREFAAAVRISGPGHLAGITGRLVFEGAQGVLLDEWRGLHPHTTWSTVEPSGARRMLRDIGCDAYILGVTRAYLTRHGAGPFPSADPALDSAIRERHNRSDGYQGAFRSGHFDPVLLRYAIAACGGVDGIALTHLDSVGPGPSSVAAYATAAGLLDAIELGPWRDLDYQQRLTDLLREVTPVLEPMTAPVPDFVAAALGVPVVLTADGPERAARRAAAVRA